MARPREVLDTGLGPELDSRAGRANRDFGIDWHDIGRLVHVPQMPLNRARGDTVSKEAMGHLGEDNRRGLAYVCGIDEVAGLGTEAGSLNQLDPCKGIHREIQAGPLR